MKSNNLKLVTFISIIFIMASCTISIQTNAVNPAEYLGQSKNTVELYHKHNDNLVLLPFNFAHTDFGRLILVGIDNHSQIETVELVVESNNKGAFVVVYYHNKSVECYPNTQLSTDKKYLQPNKDWTLMEARDFDFSFLKTGNKIELSVDIEIKNNSKISIHIANKSKSLKTYSFLAAIGAELYEVKRFPLIYLQKAGFLSVEDTESKIEIDNKIYKLKKTTLKVEKLSCYRTVYAFDPQPFFWNEERDTQIIAVSGIERNNIQTDCVNYTFTDNKGYTEISKISYKTGKHNATYQFSPPIPDFTSLKQPINTSGKFCIHVDTIEGVVAGKYIIEKRNETITFCIEPQKCWQPMPGNDWVRAYKYKAEFSCTESSKYQIKSKWNINK